MNQVPLVTPFKGERYAAVDRLGQLISPPYDVISPAERQELAARHLHNVVHIILPEGAADRYRQAAATLRQWRRSGVLVRDPSAAVYVVQQEFCDPAGRTRVRTGFIGALSVEPFTLRRVRPHERTHLGPKQDRLALLRETRTMSEALFLLAPDRSGELARCLESATARQPDAQTEFQGETVRVWRLTDREARALCEAAGRESLYIADGHHRYETALAFREEYPSADRTLALIVPVTDPGLLLLPTHRLIYGSPVAWESVQEVVSAWFETQEISPPLPRDQLIVGLPGPRLFSLRPRPLEPHQLEDLAPAVKRLTVSWADRLVLPLLLGGSGEVAYTSRAEKVVEELGSGKAAAALLLPPPTVEQVLEVADAGATMPQKSTYFFPKVPSGLVMLNWAQSDG